MHLDPDRPQRVPPRGPPLGSPRDRTGTWPPGRHHLKVALVKGAVVVVAAFFVFFLDVAVSWLVAAAVAPLGAAVSGAAAALVHVVEVVVVRVLFFFSSSPGGGGVALGVAAGWGGSGRGGAAWPALLFAWSLVWGGLFVAVAWAGLFEVEAAGDGLWSVADRGGAAWLRWLVVLGWWGGREDIAAVWWFGLLSSGLEAWFDEVAGGEGEGFLWPVVLDLDWAGLFWPVC